MQGFSCAQPCVGRGLTLGGRSHRPTRGLLTAGPSDQGWGPVESWGSGAHLPALSPVGLCPWLLRQGEAWVAWLAGLLMPPGVGPTHWLAVLCFWPSACSCDMGQAYWSLGPLACWS